MKTFLFKVFLGGIQGVLSIYSLFFVIYLLLLLIFNIQNSFTHDYEGVVRNIKKYEKVLDEKIKEKEKETERKEKILAEIEKKFRNDCRDKGGTPLDEASYIDWGLGGYDNYCEFIVDHSIENFKKVKIKYSDFKNVKF